MAVTVGCTYGVEATDRHSQSTTGLTTGCIHDTAGYNRLNVCIHNQRNLAFPFHNPQGCAYTSGTDNNSAHFTSVSPAKPITETKPIPNPKINPNPKPKPNSLLILLTLVNPATPS